MNVGITIGVSPEAFTGIIQSFISGIMKKPPGLSVSIRAELEKAYPIEKRLGLGKDIQEIRIANYACNSLFAPQNGESRGLARNENLANIVDGLVKREHVQFSVVITKPECEAAKEAVRNEKIINHDIEKNERKKVFSSALEEMQKCIAQNGKYCKEYRENQVRFACTEISLPYGIFQVTYKNHKQDHIKVDLYSPYIPHESERLSMLIYRKKNEQLYKIFSDEFDRILSHSEYLVTEG